MAVLNRALWFNGLVDDDGTGLLGTIWQKAQVGLFMDTIDAAIANATTGPGSGVSVVGNIATWNNTTGTLLNDTGVALAAVELITRKNAASGYAGLDASSKLTGSQQVYGAAANTACQGNDARLSDARTPTAHAASHRAGGSDVLVLDLLGAPTDVTTLNATTTAHGLLPKLPGGTTTFLRGDGTFAVPPGGTPIAHASTHAAGGSDVVDVKTLGGYPGGTTTFLRADGTFVVPPGGGAGGGNVNGPATSVLGRVATWNDTTGTTLADGGVLLSSLVTTTDPRLSDARTPTAHATSHKSGGSDAIKLDELAAPTDVTTLNVSTTAHGLAPKLPGNTTTFLRGDGTYATPVAGGTPGGSDTQVQFNDSAAFGGDSGLTFNKTTDVLSVGGGLVSSGDFVFAVNGVLRRNTTAGSDSGYVGVNGGGDAGGSTSRGASFWVYGNQNANTGQVLIYPGNIAGARVEMAGQGGSYLRFAGADGAMTFSATTSSAAIFNSTHASGTALRLQRSGANLIQMGSELAILGFGSAAVASVYVNTWPTTGSPATAVVTDGDFIRRSTSSIRYKADVATLAADDWRGLLRLRPISFVERARPDGVRYYGFIAEEVAEVFDRLVTYDAVGRPDYVHYDRLTAPLVLAIQEFHRRLEAAGL